MPTPERTSLDAILDAATDLLERDGLDGLTMQAVAQAVGVRAPSLYKRVRNRDEVLRLVAERVAVDLGAALEQAVAAAAGARGRLLALARATRTFAHRRPNAYSLLFARLPEAALPDPGVLHRTVAAVLRVSTELAGAEHALEGARTLTAWVHGFVTMELAGRFRMGDDLDGAFAYGAERLADALSVASDD